jgi:tetratricopeptide (TPR) repeat protein
MVRAVSRRLEGLPDATRALLEIAAVLGREFPLAALASVQSCPQPELLSDLDPALREGLVEPVPASAGARVRFSHALVRDALYGSLGLARRVFLHGQVGEALEACHRADQLPLYELAHHFYLAAPQGCAPKAIDYALRAARQAEQVFAFDSAASLRDRVFELSCALPEPDAGTLCDLLIAAGHAWYRAGELEKATARYGRAADQARVHGDAARLALGASFYAKARRGFVLFDAYFVPLVRSALAALPAGDDVLKAKLLGFRCLAAGSLGPAAEREAATREALEMARRIGDPAAIRFALTLRRWLMAGALHPSETHLIATELIDRARRANEDDGVLEGLFWRLQDQLELGQAEPAARDFAEYGALAESERNMTHRYWALLFEAMQRSWRGELTQALELADRALAFGQRIREPMAAMIHAFQVWNIRDLLGTSDQPPDAIAGLASLAHAAPRALSLVVHLAQGRHDDARRLYEELARNDFADVAHDLFRRILLAAASAGCAAFDDRAHAKTLYELLAPDAELNVIGLSSWVFLGPVSQFLGRLAQCMHEYELAAQHFERALAQCASFGARPQLAILQYEYAQMLRGLPGARAGRAAQLLAQAERAAQELGMLRWPPSRS